MCNGSIKDSYIMAPMAHYANIFLLISGKMHCTLIAAHASDIGTWHCALIVARASNVSTWET
jgi:hypothetical protein